MDKNEFEGDDESYSSSTESSETESNADMEEIGDENVDVDKVMTYYAANLSDDAVNFWANQKEISKTKENSESSDSENS